ncbi:hypothetical protein F3Y22_tig00117056pilonHSYRG00762 [Hibiscus syriacus]|uniref:Uncharacterized protein n=1 Tax=Hibiscus syriacus TaxID=106335 RepID=A0A6A2WDC9_HIBSY|nr:hypothetical protein F3Y22_tig00117056pilonHSYRG00762 [Hibiscus syriacus]
MIDSLSAVPSSELALRLYLQCAEAANGCDLEHCRALRIANAAQQMANAARGSGGPVTLFVEILNKSVLRTVPDQNFAHSTQLKLLDYNQVFCV